MPNPFRPRKKRELPTREQLDKTPARSRTLGILLAGALIVGLAIAWWIQHGAIIASRTLGTITIVTTYWSTASKTEKTTWEFIIASILAIVILAIWLIHRFVWRALFPDLRRLDTTMHAGGLSERVGRLYHIRPYRDEASGTTRFRHYYKEGHRWLPLFRFDHIDLDEPASHAQYGVAVIRCGRIDRTSDSDAFTRTPAQATLGAAPLSTAFREHEVKQDHKRKTNIVAPGAAMNPEVMRNKWRNEPMMTTWTDETG